MVRVGCSRADYFGGASRPGSAQRGDGSGEKKLARSHAPEVPGTLAQCPSTRKRLGIAYPALMRQGWLVEHVVSGPSSQLPSTRDLLFSLPSLPPGLPCLCAYLPRPATRQLCSTGPGTPGQSCSLWRPWAGPAIRCQLLWGSRVDLDDRGRRHTGDYTGSCEPARFVSLCCDRSCLRPGERATA